MAYAKIRTKLPVKLPSLTVQLADEMDDCTQRWHTPGRLNLSGITLDKLEK